MLTPYQFASNSPIAAIDVDGLEGSVFTDKVPSSSTVVKKTTSDVTKELIEDAVEIVVKKAKSSPITKAKGIFINGMKWLAGRPLAVVGFMLTPVPTGMGASPDPELMRVQIDRYLLENSIERFTNDPSSLSDDYMRGVRERVMNQTATEQDYVYADDAFGRVKAPRQLAEKENMAGFNRLAQNPTMIWGMDSDEVGEILGNGWKLENLNSGDGWKYVQNNGDGFVSYTTGNDHHPDSEYYKINNGSVGKNKVVGENYQATADDKSKIYRIQNGN